MFNKEEFIKDYIEAVRKNDTEEMQQVLSRLTADQNWDTRKELVEGIVAGVKELEGDYAIHLEFLSKQLELIEAAKKAEEDSSSEDAKDTSKAEEATQDVAADTGADEAVDCTTEKSAESGGYAPATDEKEGKSE